MSESTTSFRIVRSIPATPAEVYRALLDADTHSAFTGAEATGDGQVGSPFSAWDGYIQGIILELEEGKRIVQEWSTTEWPRSQPPSRVEFRFEPNDEGTRLRLVHSLVPVSQSESYRQGWIDYYFTPLEEFFARY